MPQILGVEGEVVVLYREPSTTQVEDPASAGRCGILGFPAGYNKMAAFECFQHPSCSGFQQGPKNKEKPRSCSF